MPFSGFVAAVSIKYVQIHHHPMLLSIQVAVLLPHVGLAADGVVPSNATTVTANTSDLITCNFLHPTSTNDLINEQSSSFSGSSFLVSASSAFAVVHVFSLHHVLHSEIWMSLTHTARGSSPLS